MDYTVRPVTEEEKKYARLSLQQISVQTGCIGYIKAEITGINGTLFLKWEDRHAELNTQAFTEQREELMHELFEGSGEQAFLSSIESIREMCRKHPEAKQSTNEYDRNFIFRVDVTDYAYLIMVNANAARQNAFIVCYLAKWLDDHIKKARVGIDIPNGKGGSFHLEDGGHFSLVRKRSFPEMKIARYIDDNHFAIDGQKSDTYTFNGFKEVLARDKALAVPDVGAKME